jgi:hypothetical protein
MTLDANSSSEFITFLLSMPRKLHVRISAGVPGNWHSYRDVRQAWRAAP